MAKTKLKKLPTSKAKNAYDLLTDVAKAIQEEPLRVNMDEWIVRRERLEWWGREVPACGTVACIAGWTALLVNPRQNARTAETAAHRLLGSRRYIFDHDLYDDYDDEVNELFHNFPRWGNAPGTMEYAKEVILEIKSFQRRHKKRLLATRIVRKPKPKASRVSSR